MTRVRKLALEISSWVTWLAAPGCKEWAEGLEHEVAFIESDWSALRWAIGSTRIVFVRRGSPIRSLEDVPAASREFLDLKVWIFIDFGNQLAVTFAAVSAVFLGLTFVGTRWPIGQVGAVLMLGAAILYCCYWQKDCRDRVKRCPQPPLPSDPHECALVIRLILRLYIEIQCGWVSNACLAGWWLGLLLFNSFGNGYGSFEPILSSWSFILLSALMLMQVRADKLKRQRQIANLDALRAERR
jgi:hypothetical protein